MKTIVYTAILGTSDSLKPSPKGADACVCFVDDPASFKDAKGWELRPFTYLGDPRRQAWQLRCLPHIIFSDYERVIWIDASFTLTNLQRLLRDSQGSEIAAIRHHRRSNCYDEGREIAKIGQADGQDVARQLQAYRSEGFDPAHLSISCIIVRDRSNDVQGFNDTWDAQIRTYQADNTQISLDYSAWKNGLTIKALTGSRHDNPYAEHDHEDHKKRRKPYQTAVAS